MSKTRPGSRAHQIVGVVTALSTELERGIDMAEIAGGIQQATGGPVPASLTSEVASLARRGVLQVAGGRVGHYLYALPGSAASVKKQDDALVVLEAVRSGYRRTRRPLSTRAVEAEIGRRGVPLETRGPDTVRKHLEGLARERKRGPKKLRAPQVERLTVTTEAGQPRVYWVPSRRSGDEAKIAPWSAAETARVAVREASTALGRPVSRGEIRAWTASAACAAGVRHALKDLSIGRALAATARQDTVHAGIDGRIHTITTGLTAFGGAPPRYLLGAATIEANAVCAMEDVLLAYRPAEDTQSIDVLRRRASMASSAGLVQLARVRQALLAACVTLPAGEPDSSLVLDRVDAASSVLERWWASAPATSRDVEERRTRMLADRRRQVAAVRALLPLDGALDGTMPARAGQEALVTATDLQYWLACAIQKVGISDAKALRLVERARRFPAPTPPGQDRFGAAGTAPLAYLDRVDALRWLFRSFPVSRAKALIEQGSLALGTAFRDSKVLEGLLADLPPRDGFGRRTLVLALGLLGRVVDSTVAVPDAERADDTSAWVLATVVADPNGARDRIRAADRRARAGARSVTDTALLRLRAGYGYSVVER